MQNNRFLTEEKFRMMKDIRFEYVYGESQTIFNKHLSYISYFDEAYPYLLQEATSIGFGDGHALVQSLILQGNTQSAERLVLENGDMVVSISSKFNESSRFCLPLTLSEMQLIKLRLWLEYFRMQNNVYSVLSYQNSDKKVVEIPPAFLDTYFDSLGVFCDEHIQELIRKKEPNFF